jgi:hypothetical protein
MEQLSTLDAGFLQAEDSDRHVSMAIGAVAVLAGPMPAFDRLAAAPDIDELASGIEQAVARLTALSAGHWRSTPVGTLALVQGG